MKKRYSIPKEQCTCGISELYDNVAKIMGISDVSKGNKHGNKADHSLSAENSGKVALRKSIALVEEQGQQKRNARDNDVDQHDIEYRSRKGKNYLVIGDLLRGSKGLSEQLYHVGYTLLVQLRVVVYGGNEQRIDNKKIGNDCLDDGKSHNKDRQGLIGQAFHRGIVYSHSV